MLDTIDEALGKVAAEPEGLELPEGATSLQFMQAIYRDSRQPMTRRMRAASIAIAYEHPKLAVAVSITAGFGSQMEALMEKRAGMRSVIDAPKAQLAKPED